MSDFLKEVLEVLKAEEGKEYSGQFTFAQLDQHKNYDACEWVNDAFETREAAIEAAIEKFPNGYAIGQLKSNGLNYDVVNVEKIYAN